MKVNWYPLKSFQKQNDQAQARSDSWPQLCFLAALHDSDARARNHAPTDMESSHWGVFFEAARNCPVLADLQNKMRIKGMSLWLYPWNLDGLWSNLLLSRLEASDNFFPIANIGHALPNHETANFRCLILIRDVLDAISFRRCPKHLEQTAGTRLGGWWNRVYPYDWDDIKWPANGCFLETLPNM